MLELDLLLQGFLVKGYDELSKHESAAFEQLLEMQDEVLQGWLLSDVIPTDGVLISVVKKIRAAAAR